MKKGWKIIGVVVLVVIILAAICVAIGLLAGADYSRIYTAIDSQYNLNDYMALISSYSAAA